jgi:hypothetical protein
MTDRLIKATMPLSTEGADVEDIIEDTDIEEEGQD